MLQVLLEYGIVDQNGNSKLDEDDISINELWQLYKKVENEKEEIELERSKEFDQVIFISILYLQLVETYHRLVNNKSSFCALSAEC